MNDKALEAAVRAVEQTGLLEGDEARSAAQAAITAYLAQCEADGEVMASKAELAELRQRMPWAGNPPWTCGSAMIAARPKGFTEKA